MTTGFYELNLRQFDPDALLHVLNGTEMEHRLLSGGTQNAHVRRLVLGDLTIEAGTYGFPVYVNGGIPLGKVRVGLLTANPKEIRINNREISLNELQLYAPGCELQYLARTGSEWAVLELSLEQLQATAIAAGYQELDWPRQGVRYLDIHLRHAQRLRRELHGLFRQGEYIASVSDGMPTELLATEGLIQLLVQTIVNGAESARSQPPLSVGRRRALAAMEACIQRWKENPVDVLHIADIEGTTERMLELAAREAYGITPQHWFKLARLNAAYADLLNGRGRSVTEISERWQFHHMGYFARDYQTLFGELPSETFRKRRTEGTGTATASRSATKIESVYW